MAKLTRVFQKVFGSSASGTQIGTFGSLAAGSPAYTSDPTVIQSLSAFLNGWYSAVIGGNSPAIQDMNALFFLAFRQIAYGFQSGIPELDATTTYFIGSLVSDGFGNIYTSLTDDNIGNALSSSANWRTLGLSVSVFSISANTTLVAKDTGKTFLVNSSSGAITINLPALTANHIFTVKDTNGSFALNPITIHRASTELIENIASDYICESSFGSWTFFCNGTSWFIN